MRSFEAFATINATPQAIWGILTDVSGYTTWDSGVDRVDGLVAPGASITVFSKVRPGQAFPVKVTELQPPRSMRWASGLPLGLFTGERTFTLAPDANNSVRFTMREEYKGLLAAFIFRSVPDLTPSFRQFADGLKQRAERAG